MCNAPQHKIKAKQNNEASLTSRINALKLAIENPASANIELIYACKSQTKLANLQILQLGIYSMSLNTLKETSNRILEDGFHSLELLRKQLPTTYEHYLSEINNINKKNTKSYYQEKIHALEITQQNLINSLIFLTEKYTELLSLHRRLLAKIKDGNINVANETRLLEQHLKRFGEQGSRNLTVVTKG